MFLDAWEFVIGAQQDEGKAFVVAQQDIVGRAVPLDELRFQQQGFGFAVGRHDRHRPRQRDHASQPVRQPVNLHIIVHAIFKRTRLADIKHVAARIVHPIHTRLVWQGFQDIANGRNTCFQIGCIGTPHCIGCLLLVETGGCIWLIGAVGFGHKGGDVSDDLRLHNAFQDKGELIVLVTSRRCKQH